jgi:hypothetical protein
VNNSGSAIQQVLDREALRDLVHAYCYAIDTSDTRAVAELFTVDGIFATSTGRNGTAVGRGPIGKRVELLLSTFAATSHHASNIRIEFVDFDTAEIETYLYAWHRFKSDRPDGYLWGRYVDIASRTPAGWKLKNRTLKIVGQVDFPFDWIPYREGSPT